MVKLLLTFMLRVRSLYRDIAILRADVYPIHLNRGYIPYKEICQPLRSQTLKKHELEETTTSHCRQWWRVKYLNRSSCLWRNWNPLLKPHLPPRCPALSEQVGNSDFRPFWIDRLSIHYYLVEQKHNKHLHYRGGSDQLGYLQRSGLSPSRPSV